jgi:hypothetical protein
MSPDLMDAHSRRYSQDCIMFLPLISGKFALLSCRRDLVEIVDTIEEVVAKGKTAFSFNTSPKVVSRATIEINLDDINLDDLDLSGV